MKSEPVYMPYIPTSELTLISGKVAEFNRTYMVHDPVFKTKKTKMENNKMERKPENINSIEGLRRYIEGCLNDYDSGEVSQDETIGLLSEMTMKISERNAKRAVFNYKKEIK